MDTPMEANLKLHSDEGNLLPNPTLYRQLIGSLMYLTFTRPDISYAVNIVNQFMISPSHLYLAAVYRIPQYLKSTPKCGLFSSHGSSLTSTAYADADWSGCPNTRKSTIGWYVYLGQSLIPWKCKKQERVSKSSAEAEYRTMCSAFSKIEWLHGVLTKLGFSHSAPTHLYDDNTSAIKIDENSVLHK